MNYKRREFLRRTGNLAAGIALAPIACKLMPKDAQTKPFGLQLYTLRDDLPKDPKGILKQVSTFGYKQLEGYEGPQGMFWGMSNKDFKKYLDDLGMTMISSHCDINKDFDQKAAQAAEIGMIYLICPY